MLELGVDFGGTKVEAAVLDEEGQVLVRQRIPTPDSYPEALAGVRDLVTRIEAGFGPFTRLGVGSPGTEIPSSGLIKNANTLYLNGRNFRSDLATILGKQVRVANDANCFALSEAIDGAAQGASVVFGVILGTGCGGGLVVNGRLITGANGITGEWGHIPLPWPDDDEAPGPDCWCGHKGCLELWVSGTGLQRDVETRSDGLPSGRELFERSEAGDAAAMEVADRFFLRLARGLASIVNVVDPDVFVFGGGLSNVTEIYRRVPRLMRPYVFGGAWEGRLVQAQWGDSSGVRGAARLWRDGQGGERQA